MSRSREADAAKTQDYWNDFYTSPTSGAVPREPSSFALWTHEHLAAHGAAIREFGFGTARDSFWFASRGHSVVGYDFASAAVEAADDLAAHRNLDARFERLDLSDGTAVSAVAAEIAGQEELTVVYGRFLIHALDDRARHNFFDLAAAVLPGKGGLFLEFRTGRDRNTEHVFGEAHYRKYLDPDHVVAEVESRGGEVGRLVAGHGLAVHKSEDPHVARLVAEWA